MTETNEPRELKIPTRNTMQAIITKVIPQTNIKPTRIRAACARGRKFFSITHLSVSVDSEEAHRAAARELIDKFRTEDAARIKLGCRHLENNPWSKPFVSGCLPNGDFVHVFVS